MLVNFSNHASDKWSEGQTEAAGSYGNGEIVDVAFPNVPSDATPAEIRQMAEECVEKIKDANPDAVLVQGEFTLAFAVTTELMKDDIPVVAATSERKSVETVNDDGTVSKSMVFEFVQFREYTALDDGKTDDAATNDGKDSVDTDEKDRTDSDTSGVCESYGGETV